MGSGEGEHDGQYSTPGQVTSGRALRHPQSHSWNQRQSWVERAAWQEPWPSEETCCQPIENRQGEKSIPDPILLQLPDICSVPNCPNPTEIRREDEPVDTVHRGQPVGQSVGGEWRGIPGQMEDTQHSFHPAPYTQAISTIQVNVSSPFFVLPQETLPNTHLAQVIALDVGTADCL